MQTPKTTSPIRGFTLIEILVAISIIAVLTMLSLFTFSSVQRRSRDVKRQSDLKVLQGALEQYHADQGFYPKNHISGLNESFTTLVSDTSNSLTNGTGNPTIPSPVKTYVSRVPTDPINAATSNYTYLYLARTSTGGTCNNTTTYCTSYSLCARLENTTTGTCSQAASTQNFEVTPP